MATPESETLADRLNVHRVRPAPASRLFCTALRDLGVRVATGRFGARMAVELMSDGPVTIVL